MFEIDFMSRAFYSVILWQERMCSSLLLLFFLDIPSMPMDELTTNLFQLARHQIILQSCTCFSNEFFQPSVPSLLPVYLLREKSEGWNLICYPNTSWRWETFWLLLSWILTWDLAARIWNTEVYSTELYQWWGDGEDVCENYRLPQNLKPGNGRCRSESHFIAFTFVDDS